jgi:glycosyltransferase involved in cell wall biosynthesis
MKIAIVHDWLTNMGGGEKVIENFLGIYPGAPIFTSVANRAKLSEKLQTADITTSFLQKPYARKMKGHQKYFPFMPMAFESFDLNEFDVVLSSSTSCAKGVITPPGTMHVCYCNSPMRYGWEFYYDYTRGMGKLKKKLVKYLMNYMRIWDVASANRVDYFIANSQNVARRIWKHYRRESTVIYPPVDTEFYTPEASIKREDCYLCVSRLVAYKRLDLAVDAFGELGLPLVIIGAGEELDRLKRKAKPNVQFLGRQPDDAVRDRYRKCKAFIFPGEEDFGITPVEAQACGCPVIAYGKGGVLETVIDGETGVFFGEQTVEGLKAAVLAAQGMRFDAGRCRGNAERFGEERFRETVVRFISEKRDEYREIAAQCGGVDSKNEDCNGRLRGNGAHY